MTSVRLIRISTLNREEVTVAFKLCAADWHLFIAMTWHRRISTLNHSEVVTVAVELCAADWHLFIVAFAGLGVAAVGEVGVVDVRPAARVDDVYGAPLFFGSTMGGWR